MADSAVFDWACEALERESGLTRLQARGTMRIVVTEAGLDSRSLTAAQLRVVAARLLPKQLKSRGVKNEALVCEALARCPASVESTGAHDVVQDAEEIFKRLGRRE